MFNWGSRYIQHDHEVLYLTKDLSDFGVKKCHNRYVELRWLFESYMLRCFPQKRCFLLGKNIRGCSEGAQNSIKWIAESENSTVEWFRNPVNSPVEVGSLSSLYIYQGFRRIPGGLKSPGFSVCHQRCMLLFGAGLTTCFASNEPTPSQRNIRCDFLPGKDGDTWRIIPVS